MCGGCGGTPSQATTTSTPPPWAEQGIASVAGGAGGIAGLYQSGAYGGYPLQGTAPMNQSQLDALNMMMSAPGVAGPFTTQAMQDYYSGANLIGGGSQLIGGGAGLISEGGPFLGAGANIIGGALPYFSQAAQYAAQGASPLLPDVQQFMSANSPYIQGVVNATENQFNNQNAIQDNALLGSTIQAGANSVLNTNSTDARDIQAKAILANQQQLAQAPVIAGEYEQGYQTSLAAAEAQHQANLSAAGLSTNIGAANIGAGTAMGGIGLGLGTLGAQMGQLGGVEGGLGAQMGGLGAETAQLGLGNAQLALNAGAAAFPAATVGQTTSQAALNAQYAQLMQQFGLPAGIESWLSGIQLPAYAETGGISNTTGQQGNLWSDFLGLLTAGAGAAGKVAATGKDGGRVGFQGGGVPLGGIAGAPIGSPQYSAFLSPGIFVPPNIQKHGIGIPTSHLPTRQAQQHPSQNTGAGLMGLGSLARKFSLPQANVGVSGSPDDVSVNSGVGAVDMAQDIEQDAGDWRGGVVGYQDGGDTGDYAEYMAAVEGPLAQEETANARLPGYAEGGEAPDDADTNPAASSGIAPDLPPPQDIATAPRFAAADNIGNYSDAIAAVESKGHGDYGAIGPPVRRKDHIDHAYGRHQVMGDSIPEWTKEAIGKAMTPQEFLRSPEAQEAVFRHKFGSYVDKYGNPQDAASVWFTGRPQSKGGQSSDGYITGNEYVRRFNNALGFANDRGVAPDESQGAITHALGFDREAGVSPPIRTAQAAPTSGGHTDTGGLLGFIDSLRPTMSKETKMALMAAGFGMMGPHRDFFRNLGAGAQQGIGTYMTAEKLSQEAQATQARIQREREQSEYQRGALALAQRRESFMELQPTVLQTPTGPISVQKLPNGTYRNIMTNEIIQPGSTASGLQVASGAGTTPAEAAAGVHAIGTHPEVLEQLRKIDPNMPNLVKSIAEGRTSLQSVGYKDKTLLAKWVNAYDPEWDQQVFQQRQRQMNDLASNGNDGKMLLAVNQLLPHLATASQKAEELDNADYPAMNTIKNWWLQATGDPRVQKFNTVREVAALDAARLLRGSGQMSEKDIEEWRKRLNEAGSPRQLQGVIAELGDDLIHARVGSIEHGYRMIMKKEPQGFVSDDAKHALKDITDRRDIVEAKDALARGANQEEIVKQMRDKGIDPARLNIVIPRSAPAAPTAPVGTATAAPAPATQPKVKYFKGKAYIEGPNGESVPYKP